MEKQIVDIVNGHADTLALESELTSARVVLETYESQRAALTEAASNEMADLDAALREKGQRGRGPLPDTESRARLRELESLRAGAAERVVFLPGVLTKRRAALAEAAAEIPAAEQLEEKYNLLAQEALEALGVAVGKAKIARAKYTALTELADRLSKWFSITLNAAPLFFTNVDGAYIETIRRLKVWQESNETAKRHARGERTEQEVLDADFVKRGTWQVQLSQSAKAYRATKGGEKLWAEYKNSLLAVQALDSVAHGDPVRAAAVEAAQRRLNMFHEAACGFAKLTVYRDFFPQLEG